MPEPSDLETAVGMVFGLEPGVPAVRASRRDPVEAVGDVLEPYLASGPCLVWQTGDGGGALALAAAVRRARREALPDPIPLTLVTTAGAPDDEHVRALLDALGLREWQRADAVGRLDLLGPAARAGLLRHGVRYPSVGHVVVPAAQAAGGGTLVDCHGLREAWDFWRGAAVRRFVDARARDRRAAGRAVLALAPRPVRRRAVQARLRSFELPYVRPEVLAWLRARWLEETVTMPLTSSAAIRLLHQRRCLWETARTFASLGADHGTKVVHPFTDPAVAAALGGAAGRRGWSNSSAMLAKIAPEVPARAGQAPGLPPEPFWAGPESAAFIEEWDGTGLDESLVDPGRLREAWRRHDARAGALLQTAWLATAPRASPGTHEAAHASGLGVELGGFEPPTS